MTKNSIVPGNNPNLLVSSSRATWMDVTRGVCMLLVILSHAVDVMGKYLGIAADENILVINEFFSPYRMPLLMFLSGMLLNRSLRKSTWPYVAGKLNLIFWPMVLWSVIILFVEQRITFVNLAKLAFSPPTYLWYLWFIAAYYIIAKMIFKFTDKILLISIISLTVAAIVPDVARLSRFFYLFAFFMMGHWVVSHNYRPSVYGAFIG